MLLEAKDVVICKVPYTDFTQLKARPALVLDDLNKRDDVLLCMITKQAYSDAYALKLTTQDFESGNLHQKVSYIRVSKLFTTEKSIISKIVGRITPEMYSKVKNTFAILCK